jgi:hypothetical protein
MRLRGYVIADALVLSTGAGAATGLYLFVPVKTYNTDINGDGVLDTVNVNRLGMEFVSYGAPTEPEYRNDMPIVRPGEEKGSAKMSI